MGQDENGSVEREREVKLSSVDGNDASGNSATQSPAASASPAFQKGLRFYAIMVAIGFAGVLTALEGTITSTALPSIVAELGGGYLYIWAVDGYLLAMTALQPLQGQLANIFGRRWPTIISAAAFILGSGISGGATSMGMLIAGRTIQGVGAGGINVLIEIIVCDLVPLRQRSTYTGIIFGCIALGTALGPFFGGLIVQHTTWRWIFYINLPIGSVVLLLLVVYLKVNYNKDKTFAQKVTQIDFLGNIIFIAAICSILMALSRAGALYPWSSFRIIVPLVLGMVGLIGFFLLQASPKLVSQPTIPLRLVSNRTSAVVFGLTFANSIITLWVFYFLPVYFQGVLGSSPSRSGVQLLPTIFLLVLGAGVGGTLMTKLGRYRPIHLAGFAFAIIGFGLFTLLDKSSTTGYWVGFQFIQAFGAGLVIPTLLPAVLAPLTEADTAVATATWSFVRSFGVVWGTAIPAAVFNNRFDQLATARIQDQQLVASLVGGKAYEHATAAFLQTLDPDTREQFQGVLSDSLRFTWYVAIAFAAFGFLIVAIEKEIPLREELETEFGLEGSGDKDREKGEKGRKDGKKEDGTSEENMASDD